MLAAIMFMGAPIDTKCDPVFVPSANPVPVAHDTNDDVRGAPVVDAGCCDIDDELPLSQSGLPSNAVAQYTALNQPTLVVKAFPDNQANCTVLPHPSYLIDPPLRLGISDNKGRTAASTTTAVCIPTQPKLLVGTNTMEQNVHFNTLCGALQCCIGSVSVPVLSMAVNHWTCTSTRLGQMHQ